jgi:TolB protein
MVPLHGFTTEDYSWSPDSKWICLSAADPAKSPFRLYLVRPSGSKPVKLTRITATGCSWSPDGKQLTFSNLQDLYSINTDGTGLTRLTRTAAKDLNPEWSPDGTRIAFLRQESGGKHAPYDLWTMTVDGSDQTPVARNVSPKSWSPDGTMFAFIRGERSAIASNGTVPEPQGLWVTQSDGSGQIEIARGAEQVDWQRVP